MEEREVIVMMKMRVEGKRIEMVVAKMHSSEV
jgi:hypothetical protein